MTASVEPRPDDADELEAARASGDLDALHRLGAISDEKLARLRVPGRDV